MPRIGLRMLAAISILPVLACSAKESLSAADAAVVRFHRQMELGQFRALYASSSTELKKATSEQDFVRLLTAVNTKLGPVKRATQTGWNVDYTMAGSLLSLTFETDFEKGKGVEQFVYRVSGEKPLLVVYNINSNDLITK